MVAAISFMLVIVIASFVALNGQVGGAEAAGAKPFFSSTLLIRRARLLPSRDSLCRAAAEAALDVGAASRRGR